MMPVVQSRRILKGGYSPGAEALIAGPGFKSEEIPPPQPVGPTPGELEQATLNRIESARAEALADGYRQGVIDGRKAIDKEIAFLKDFYQTIESEIDLLWEKIEQHTAGLAIEIGRKIVGDVVESHSDLAVEMARRGIITAREQTNLTVLVNPDDVEVLKNASFDLLKSAEGVRHIEIAERASVSKGGVIIECEVGQFDLRPEIQLQVIENRLGSVAAEIEHDA